MKAKTVVGDKGYGTCANYEYLQENNITPCIPHQRHKSSQGADFTSDKFVYDSIGDCYICPAGEKLKRISTNEAAGTVQYRAQRETCETCDYFKRCVTGQKAGRSVLRNPNAQYYHWADGCLPRHERYRLMSRRKYKAEGSFADAANNHGFKQARWRGLYKMQIQNLMIAAIQNLGKLLRYGGGDGKPITAAMTIKAFFRSVYLCRCRFLLVFTPCMSEY